jgi:hypothetical protein
MQCEPPRRVQSRRRSCAFAATTIVDALMNTAANAGGRTTPAKASGTAASGTAASGTAASGTAARL